jgi:DNA-directed RNA polymerase specialized sigma24 family protein
MPGHNMSFPQTRLTLIQRLASGGSEDDWQNFLKDYWGPVCRFSLRFGARNLDDAEDVASQTFEVLWENRLLVRWVSHRSAKLRSLLCAVVRNILANRHSVGMNRERLAREVAACIKETNRRREEQDEAFYTTWVEDILQQTVESLAAEYYAEGKGDYVRVLYGRLCERVTIAEAAEDIEITPAAVDNYFRHGKKRLAKKLEEIVRRQVNRYCPNNEAQQEQEFTLEWGLLGDYLIERGGLEEAVRQAYETLDPAAVQKRHGAGLTEALTRMTAVISSSDSASPSSEAT